MLIEVEGCALDKNRSNVFSMKFPWVPTTSRGSDCRDRIWIYLRKIVDNDPWRDSLDNY